MKSKIVLLIVTMTVCLSILTGCTTKTPVTTTTEENKADSISSPSVVSDEASFEKGISKDGTFIVLTTKDLTFTNDLTVDGTFTKKDKEGKDVVTRSLAFAANSADGKIEKFTVTVPRIVINSENTLLEYGIVKGDVYVQAPGFITKEATIEGNLYFATEELKNGFSADDLTKISGDIAVKEYTK